MKFYKYFKIASLISYSLIMISGSMIGIPLIICLFSWLLDFGTLIELFALLAIFGIITSITLTKYQSNKNTFIIEVVLLGILLLPVIERFLSFPFHFFDTFYFIVPVCLFIIFYLSSLFFLFRKIQTRKDNVAIGDTWTDNQQKHLRNMGGRK